MRKYLFFLFVLLVMFTPLESHAQSYELGFACFYDGYWGSWYNTSNSLLSRLEIIGPEKARI